MFARVLPQAVLSVLLFVLIFEFSQTTNAPPAAASHAGGMDAMLIDMDPSASPVNTGTGFGTIESCARVNENDKLDADEDAIDTLEVDVIADNIPASNPTFTTYFELLFPAGALVVTEAATPYATDNGWNVLSASDVPQTDGTFEHTVVDINATGTSGSGALSRLTLETVPTVSPSVSPLLLKDPVHVDSVSIPRPPDNYDPDLGIAVQDPPVFVAVNSACLSPTPTPSAGPSPSPAPTPSATPSPGPTQSPTPSPSPTPAQLPAGGGEPTPSGPAWPVVAGIAVLILSAAGLYAVRMRGPDAFG
jgi:hypothetical protein